ncbi:hypothetical protein [Roseobacter sp.]|uniref:hypothetical protein n=1 Tax=Roseobacter sp. TaxID=1907202 RepID=UPI0029666F5B|nr:hypothetical protein [Roseobacter sp.]
MAVQQEGQPYVIVHGGVNKTATSYVQAILKRNAGKLRKRGVHYIHHRHTRKDYTYPCQLNGYEKLGLDYRRKFSDAALADQARAFFDTVPAGPGERIILSDENMSGHCGHCVRTGDVYNLRNTLVPIFASNIPFPVKEVHLAIREYADFFASAYVEFLRSASGQHLVSDLEMKRAVLSRLPSWVDLVELVQKSFPTAEIILWQHEDFGALSPRIIRNLCGSEVDVSDFALPKRSNDRPSASHRAIEVLLSEASRIGGAAALAKRAEIQDRYPRGPDWPRYDPWSPQERDHFRMLYRKDTDLLRDMKDVTLLAPSK